MATMDPRIVHETDQNIASLGDSLDSIVAWLRGDPPEGLTETQALSALATQLTERAVWAPGAVAALAVVAAKRLAEMPDLPAFTIGHLT
jgi:hypothetical protein